MGRATTQTALGPGAPWLRDSIRCLLSIGVAASAFGWLVPPAFDGAASSRAAMAPSVILVGSLSTVGLPTTPAVSRLYVRNDGSAAIRWSVTTEVVGAGAPAVSLLVWVPTDDTCTPLPTAAQPAGWSRDVLPSGAALPLCVRVSSDGSAAGVAEPKVSVAATST